MLPFDQAPLRSCAIWWNRLRQLFGLTFTLVRKWCRNTAADRKPHRSATSSTERLVVSKRSFARRTRSPAIQSSGLVPVASAKRRDSVRLLTCASSASCPAVICAGLSMNCACPPSRCGDTTSDSPEGEVTDGCTRTLVSANWGHSPISRHANPAKTNEILKAGNSVPVPEFAPPKPFTARPPGSNSALASHRFHPHPTGYTKYSAHQTKHPDSTNQSPSRAPSGQSSLHAALRTTRT